MTAITFDTHKFVRKLKDAGFEEKQAEAVADAFRDAQPETETVIKHDLKELELSLKAETQALRSDIQAMEYRRRCFYIGYLVIQLRKASVEPDYFQMYFKRA